MVEETFNGLSNIGVSVVICVYNGKDRIKQTLWHLANQKNIDFAWEVLIIDNNSTDGTAGIAMDYWTQLNQPCPLRIIKESKPGTMYARKTGIITAGFRYLLYCDDDNWLGEQYLKTAFDLIVANESFSVIGGQGVLEYEQGCVVPKWIEKYKHYYGCGPQGKQDGDTTNDKGCLYTAGAIIDRRWMDKLYKKGFTSLLKGRDGKTLAAGEDTELTYALVLIGSRIGYSSMLCFKHFMPSNRLNWDYFTKLCTGVGYSNFLLRPYNNKNFKPAYFKDAIITFLLQIKYSLKFLLSKQKEGNMYGVYAYQFKGQLKCIKIAKPIHKQMNIIIERLKSN